MISNYSNILSSCWLSKINEARSSNDDLKNLAKSNKSYIYSYNNERHYSLYVTDYKLITSHLSTELNRFACASIETVYSSGITPVLNPKSQAWRLIQLYYAAFYSAHALLRSSGNSVCMIDSTVGKSVDNKLAANGLSPAKVIRGECSIKLNSSFKTLEINYIGNLGKGTHERLWMNFAELLHSLKLNVNLAGLPSSDKFDIDSQIQDVLDNLNSNGHTLYSWLSSFRNDLTYKNGYGLWYPYVNTPPTFSIVDRYAQLWKNFPENISVDVSDELSKFVFCCHYIISLNHTNMLHLEELSSSRNNVYRNRYINFITVNGI